MGIERQGTRSTKHDGSSVLLRKILKELKEMNVLMVELKELLQEEDYAPIRMGTCCRNGCEKCEQ